MVCPDSQMLFSPVCFPLFLALPSLANFLLNRRGGPRFIQDDMGLIGTPKSAPNVGRERGKSTEATRITFAVNSKIDLHHYGLDSPYLARSPRGTYCAYVALTVFNDQ
jgi:hypothetical protein